MKRESVDKRFPFGDDISSMSIEVTVKGNPICVSRSKLLLTDLEQAKKNETNRRRKLRLQQVRQQSRDLAGKVRKKVDAELRLLERNDEEKIEKEKNDWQERQLNNLHKEFEKRLQSVGSGHQSAALQPDPNLILKEQKEVLKAVARARGALAEEKAKAEKTVYKDKENKCIQQKQFARQVEKVRSAMVMTLPMTANSKQASAHLSYRSKSPQEKSYPPSRKSSVKEKSRDKVYDVGNNIEVEPISPRTPLKDVQQRIPSNQASIHSIPLCEISPRRSPRSRSRQFNNTIPKCEDLSDSSDDSNVTWPPRSGRTSNPPVSPPKVKLYNHNERKTTEYVKPSTSVTHISPSIFSSKDMKKEIDVQEAALIEHLNANQRNLKILNQRGKKAIHKEQTQREFKNMLAEISALDKKERIESVSHFKKKPLKSQHRIDELMSKLDDSILNEGLIAEPNPECSKVNKFQHEKIPQFSKNQPRCIPLKEVAIEANLKISSPTPPRKTEDCLKDLYSRLQRERAKLLHPNHFGHIEENEDSSSDDDIEIPKWILCNETNQMLSKRKSCSPQNKTESNHEEESSSSEERAVRPIVQLPDQLSSSDIDSSIQNQVQVKKQIVIASAEKEKSSVQFPSEVTLTQSKENTDIESTISHRDSPSSQEKDNTNIQLSTPTESPKEFKDLNCSSPSSPSVQNNDSSSTLDGVKVVVKIHGKAKRVLSSVQENENLKTKKSVKEIKQSSFSRTKQSKVVQGNSSSTSYCSPPENLSPEQQNVLSNVLQRLLLKNNNPKLHHYIIELLNKSRHNISEFGVSSVSDVSIPSEICNSANASSLSIATVMSGVKHIISPRSNHFMEEEQYESSGKSSEQLRFVDSISGSSVRESTIHLLPEDISARFSDESTDLVDTFARRLEKLTDMVENCNVLCTHNTVNKSAHPDDSASLMSLPAELREFAKDRRIPRTNQFPFPEDSVPTGKSHYLEGARTINNLYMDDSTSSDISSLGLPVGLFPKPFLSQKQANDNIKLRTAPPPPPSIGKINLKAHELPTIQEADTFESLREDQAIPSKHNSTSSSSASPEFTLYSTSTSASSYKPVILEKFNDSSLPLPEPIPGPSGLQRHVNNLNRSTSSLSEVSDGEFLTDKDFNSFFDSSSDGIEEVFRSLGIGWALSTLKKTRERNKLNLESSSSTGNGSKSREITPASRSRPSTSKHRRNSSIRHSTPIKNYVKTNSALKTLSSDEQTNKNSVNQSDSNISLTPPSLSLNHPYLKK